jgi:hypothetical protein
MAHSTVSSIKYPDGKGTTALLSFMVPQQFQRMTLRMPFHGHRQKEQCHASVSLFIAGIPQPVLVREDNNFENFNFDFIQDFAHFAPGQQVTAQALFRTNNVSDDQFKCDLDAVVFTAD